MSSSEIFFLCRYTFENHVTLSHKHTSIQRKEKHIFPNKIPLETES